MKRVGFDIKSNCIDNCSVKIIVCSIDGKKLLEKTCNLKDGNCFIDAQLSNGVYMVTITGIDNNKIYQRKLTISKQ